MNFTRHLISLSRIDLILIKLLSKLKCRKIRYAFQKLRGRRLIKLPLRTLNWRETRQNDGNTENLKYFNISVVSSLHAAFVARSSK